MRKRLLILLFVSCLPVSIFAETIVLKSGKTVEGKLIEKTDKYVKIDFQGVPITYFIEEIEKVESDKFSKTAKEVFDKGKENSSSDKYKEAVAGLATFINKEHSIKMHYPKDWYLKEEHQGDLHMFYFTKERIVKRGDIYKTGIAIMKLYNADKNNKYVFKDKPDTSRRLFSEMTRQVLIQKGQLISEKYEMIRVDNRDAILSKYSFKNDFGEKETELEVVMFEDNTLVVLLMEAPIDEFNNYGPTYREIINKATFASFSRNVSDGTTKTAEEYLEDGISLASFNRIDDAIAVFTKLIKIDPTNFYAFYNRGTLYSKKGNFDQSILDYNKAIEINPRDVNPWFNRGLDYLEKANLVQAISDFNKVIEINPNYDRAYLNRGVAYDRQGNPDKAVLDYNKAIEIKPTEGLYYYNRAAFYFHKQEYDKSWADVYKIESLGVKVHPDFIKRLQHASGREK